MKTNNKNKIKLLIKGDPQKRHDCVDFLTGGGFQL